MLTSERTAAYPAAQDLFPVEVQELIDRGEGEIVLLDVATAQEFETAHLANAININYFSRLFRARLDILDRDKTYVVYCRMGARSRLAQKTMRTMGFTRVYNLVGGTLLWEEEGLPFATGRGPSKWVPCPVSITLIVSRKIKKALRYVFDAATAFRRPLGVSAKAHERS